MELFPNLDTFLLFRFCSLFITLYFSHILTTHHKYGDRPHHQIYLEFFNFKNLLFVSLLFLILGSPQSHFYTSLVFSQYLTMLSFKIFFLYSKFFIILLPHIYVIFSVCRTLILATRLEAHYYTY